MSAYRENAKEGFTVEKESKVWKGALIQTAIRCLYIVAVFIGASVGIAIVHRAMHPAPPSPPAPPEPVECSDLADIRTSSDSPYRCNSNQQLDTTRLGEGKVLMRCWCPGHQPSDAKVQTP